MSVAGEREDAMRAALAAEPDWQVLLRHFDFNEGFAFVLILVESAENGALCREALQDYLREQGRGLLRTIATNTTEDVQSLPYLLHKPKGLEGLPAIWIESVVPEGSVSPEEFEEWRKAWRVCFAGLNRIRNTIQRTIPCALVFVAAPWMQELIRRVAPDFWSIRSTVARISPRLAGRESADLAERAFRRPESDPALAPDPEFAEREADELRGKPGQELALARILQRAGEGFQARAEPAQAVRVLEEAHRLQVGASASRADLARTKAFLGRAFQMEAQWPQAEAYFLEALELDRSALGEDHPATAADLGDLASLLQATNRLKEAEPFLRRALAIDEKSYGPDHPAVATDLNNLALLLQETNRLAEAEPFFRRALAIDEKSYGPDHPGVAACLNNLARLLQATNRLAEAEPFFRRALAINEKSYGPVHPLLAVALNNLAGLLGATNRSVEAEPLYRRALAIDEKSYVPDHPAVAIRLNNLAGLLQATNRLAEAEPLYRRALAINENSFGPDHPFVATCLVNLASLLEDTSRLEEAEPLYRRALAIDESGYGQGHPEVAKDMNNLAGLLQATNRLAEAEPLYHRALAIDEKTYGPDHPSVATRLNNLASLLRDTNRLEEAEPLYRRALTILEASTATTGYQHPNLEAIRENHRQCLDELGRKTTQ
jgi:tetratricopeptide (TPR) repeat protein